MIRVCLSHDIDRTVKSYQYLTKSLRSLLKLDFPRLINQYKSLYVKDPYWGFDALIEIESKHNVKSTIFFLNESIKFNILRPKTFQLSYGRYDINSPRIIEMIRYLDTNGWEIGVHGSYNSYRELSLLIKEKKALEQIVGHEIIGIRQHYANLSSNTWAFQREAGFKYDSSFGFTDNVGFRDMRFSPFYPIQGEFLVFPLVIMDMCFMRIKDKWGRFNEIVEQCEKHNGVLVIDFHQHVFNDFEFPGYMEVYIELIERCTELQANFLTLVQAYKSYSIMKP